MAAWLASFFLYVFHALYRLIGYLSPVWKRNPRVPHALTAPRKKLPTHLAITLVCPNDLEREIIEEGVAESVEKAASWCRTIGIEVLTVYDSQGVALRCSQEIQKRVSPASDRSHEEDSDSEVEYPLTPPRSDCSESSLDEESGLFTIHVADGKERKPLNGSRKGRNVVTRRRTQAQSSTADSKPLTLHLVSREVGKPAMASTAQSLARLQKSKHQEGKPQRFDLTVEELDSCIQGRNGLPSPDLLIVHSMSSSTTRIAPAELHGFPPWQMRLTEIHQINTHPAKRRWSKWFSADNARNAVVLDELEFRSVLDEFAGAEMRLGK